LLCDEQSTLYSLKVRQWCRGRFGGGVELVIITVDSNVVVDVSGGGEREGSSSAAVESAGDKRGTLLLGRGTRHFGK